MRLIDADALKEYFKTIRKYHVGKYSEWYLADVLEQQPTVDAVQVIRCKDCGQREYGCSTFIDHNQIYGFCAWGWKAEREEE